MEENIIEIARRINSFKDIIKEYSDAVSLSNEIYNELNVFQLISDTYYKENLHSSVIAEFLNPKGMHNEGSKFLNIFLDLIEIENKEDYLYSTVTTETDGRIDICIKGNKKAIIIENKINNAGDMPFQLFRYYLYCIYILDIVDECIEGIVYLSLDGTKSVSTYEWKDFNSWRGNNSVKHLSKASARDFEKFNLKKIKHMAAFQNGASKDLSNGWLTKCIKTSTNCNNKFILEQYFKLIKQMNGKNIDPQIINKLYRKLLEFNAEKLDLDQFAEAMLNIDIGILEEIKIQLLNESNLGSWGVLEAPKGHGFNIEDTENCPKVSIMQLENCMHTEFIKIKFELFRNEFRILVTSKNREFSDLVRKKLIQEKLTETQTLIFKAKDNFFCFNKLQTNDALKFINIKESEVYKLSKAVLSINLHEY